MQEKPSDRPPAHAAEAPTLLPETQSWKENSLEATTSPPSPDAAEPIDYAAVAGYEVLGELGRGGMGVVYKAQQVKLKRLVALKMILAGSHAGPQDLERFRREAEAVAKLRHPNVVQIFEVGESEGKPFFSL